ncbi:acylphosphatase [Pseudorhizobium sp. NPDC055634]
MTQDRRVIGARIRGRVQGVGYRAWTRSEAERLGLAGWVRNEPDGTVAALLAGPAEAVDAMIERLRNGPPGASVSAVETWDEKGAGLSADFRITR